MTLIMALSLKIGLEIGLIILGYGLKVFILGNSFL